MCKLVESEATALSGCNSVSGSSCELEGTDPESFGDIKESDIVGDGADDSDDAFELVIILEGRVAIGGEMLGDA